MKIDRHPYKDRKYGVVPYDPAWPERFEEYAAKIRGIFKGVRIEHIGSTSVVGMSGKPCIDVLVMVDDLQAVDAHVAEMEQAGFEYAGEFVMANSRLFRVMQDTTQLANIHFFPVGHPHNDAMLSLRDYLRAHPEEVSAYTAIKKELCVKYPDDYAMYRKYKDEYMEEMKKRVLRPERG
ncbi:MAG: GrpB family protein [bacterium]|nr:GrpB family protein [bacterium]